MFVDAHVFDGEYQGTRSFVKEIYTRIAKRTDDFTLFLGAHDVLNLRDIFPEIPRSQFVQIKSLNRFIRLGFELPWLLRKYKIDYAHFQYMAPFFKTTKYIVTTHDVLFLDTPQWFSFPYRIQRYFFFYVSLLMADIRTTVSEFSRNSICRHFKLDPTSFTVIHNGVSKHFFQPYDKLEAQAIVKRSFGIENYVLYVSRIEPRKNHHFVLRAMRELGYLDKGIQLVFVGHESLKSSMLEQELASLTHGQRQNFHWLRNLNEADLLKVMQASRVFVYPSVSEGFGIPPLEAAALQTPTICSNLTAMKDFDFFEEGHIDTSDYDTFKKTLSVFLQSPPSHNKLELIAQEISKRYSWDASAAELCNVIQAAFNKKSIKN